MKASLVKILVLALSVSLGVAYVWRAQQKNKVDAAPQTKKVSTEENQPAPVVVTDEEVAKTRDSMLNTSKSGIIMSDTDIRAMLEEKKQQKLNEVQKEDLHIFSTSKSAGGSLIDGKDLQELKRATIDQSNEQQQDPSK